MTLKNDFEGLACAGLVMLSVVSCGAPPTPAEPLTEAVVDLMLTLPEAFNAQIGRLTVAGP